MTKWIIALALFAAPGASQAAPKTKAPAAKKAAPTKLTVCPTMLHPVPADPANALQYANMTVYFCCGGCRSKFQAMTPAVQKNRIREAMKIARGKKAA